MNIFLEKIKDMPEEEKNNFVRRHLEYFDIRSLSDAYKQLDIDPSLIIESLPEMKDIAQDKVLEKIRDRDFETGMKYGLAYYHISCALDYRIRKRECLPQKFYNGGNGNFETGFENKLSTAELLRMFGIESDKIDFEKESDLINDYIYYVSQARLEGRGVVCESYYLAADKIKSDILDKNLNNTKVPDLGER